MAPNGIFFPNGRAGQGKLSEPERRVRPVPEGLGRLSGVREFAIHLHLDILLEGRYIHLECLLKSNRERIELLQGTLDLLILRTLMLGPAHGHAIAKAIEMRSEDVLQVEQGSLYPALHRLIKRGWISVQEGISENNRRAKFYRLTARGRRQLAIETSKWDRLAGAIARILMPAEQEGES